MIKELLKGKTKKKKIKEQIEPRKYKVGVTTGIPSMDAATATEQTQKVISKGTDVIEIDLESPQTPTPHDIRELKRIRKVQGIEFTMHGATSMTLPMTSAEKIEYKKVEEDMTEYIKIAKKIGIKGINVHSSYLPSPVLLRKTRRMSHLMVDENGEKIEKKLLDSERALEWFIEERYRDPRRDQDVLFQYIRQESSSDEEAKKKMATITEEEMEKKIMEAYKSFVRRDIKDKKGGIGMDEYSAYMVMARHMYENKDYFWKKICGNKNPETLIEEGEEKKIITAVASKYVEGHIKKWVEKLEKEKIFLLIESPDCRDPRYRGYYRLVTPIHVNYVIKKLNSEYVRATIDFEHVATHGLDVLEEIKKLPSGDGRWVKMLHVASQPSPGHLHKPVEKGDKYLYTLIWELRKRGFKDGYILFEWSGKGRKEEIEKWQRSVQNLKYMSVLLENDVGPEELPPEFYGLDKGEMERERRIIEKNMFKPLEGALEAPELSHTWFAGEVMKKKKPKEVWEKEEYR